MKKIILIIFTLILINTIFSLTSIDINIKKNKTVCINKDFYIDIKLKLAINDKIKNYIIAPNFYKNVILKKVINKNRYYKNGYKYIVSRYIFEPKNHGNYKFYIILECFSTTFKKNFTVKSKIKNIIIKDCNNNDNNENDYYTGDIRDIKGNLKIQEKYDNNINYNIILLYSLIIIAVIIILKKLSKNRQKKIITQKNTAVSVEKLSLNNIKTILNQNIDDYNKLLKIENYIKKYLSYKYNINEKKLFALTNNQITEFLIKKMIMNRKKFLKY